MSRFLLALALIAPMAVAAEGAAPAGDAAPAAEKKADKPVMGEITKIADGSLTLKVKKVKEEVVIKIAAEAKIVIDGKDAKAEDLKAGQHVAVTKNAAGEAAKVEVKEPKAKGEKKEGEKH